MKTIVRAAVTAAAGALFLASAGCTADEDADGATDATTTSTSAVGSPTTGPPTSGTGTPEVLDEVTVERIQYYTGDDADPDQNWADFYLPAGEQAVDTIPLVVLIHGGGWESQIGADGFTPLAQDLAERGMAVYNIEYRRVGSGGGWPTTFRDVARALDHVVEIDRANPQITTDDELVVGHSAGAQLAVWGGTRHRLEDDEVGSKPTFRPTRVVSLAGPLDMVFAVNNGDRYIPNVMGGSPTERAARYESVDPIQNIDTEIPVVAVHGTADQVVLPANSHRYVRAVQDAGGQAKVVDIPGENHTSIVTSTSPAYPQVLDIVSDSSAAHLQEVV